MAGLWCTSLLLYYNKLNHSSLLSCCRGSSISYLRERERERGGEREGGGGREGGRERGREGERERKREKERKKKKVRNKGKIERKKGSVSEE